jgi:hypothetical protein
VVSPADLNALKSAAGASSDAFHVDDGLWVRIVYDIAAAYHHHRLDRRQLIQSSLPLYMGRVASFVNEVADLDAPGVEDRLERLCLEFESAKSYLVQRWQSPAERP